MVSQLENDVFTREALYLQRSVPATLCTCSALYLQRSVPAALCTCSVLKTPWVADPDTDVYVLFQGWAWAAAGRGGDTEGKRTHACIIIK